MPLPVRLNDIIDQLDMQSEFIFSYLNKKTGKSTVVSAEEMRYGEYADEDIPVDANLEEDSLEVARAILSSDDFIRFPSQRDIHEYRIMEQFCLSLSDEKLADELCRSMKGRGAFRKFKDKIYHYGIKQDWHKFRHEAYKQIAINWLEENDIPYVTE